MVRAVPLLILLAACGEEATPEPPARPQRIVSLLPSLTEVVVELGAAGRLVACTADCRPGRELPRVPWQGAAAAEAILRVRPDLVLRQGVRRRDDPLRRALERAGIPVAVFRSETLQDARAAIVGLGEILGKEAEARALLRRFDGGIREVRERVRGRERPSVLLVFGRDAGRAANITAAGPGSFLDELLGIAGARNVLADVDAPYPALHLEDVVRRSPDVIVDIAPPEESAALVRRAWAHLETVPAVRDGRVHALFDRALLVPGPDLPRALRRLAETIHGRAAD